MFSNRINAFSDNIHWVNDFTPESLSRLGEILYKYVNGQEISEEEYLRRVENAHIVLKKSVMRVELTDEELVLAFLTSVYIGEVIIRSNSSAKLRWDMYRKSKSFAYNGHMIIPFSEFVFSIPDSESYYFFYTILRYKYQAESKLENGLREYYNNFLRNANQVKLDERGIPSARW